MTEFVAKEPIAIIGVGCVLPDAPDADAFWANLENGRNSIRDVSPERWDPALYFDADKTVPDRTYTKIGSFVDDDNFNGLEYRMPPAILQQVDPSQRWALSAGRQALLDANYLTGVRGDEGRPFDRDRCAVIIGNAMGGETNKIAAKRLYWPAAAKAIRDDPDFQALPATTQKAILERAETSYKADTVPVTEDTMPGHLSNVVAGRIANSFDLSGKNFTTDAACASSLAALDAAVDTLRDGDADMVLWGGTDRSMDITPYIEFSKIGALSPDGSRPFDKNANGFVMGEGCAMFVLKRLVDAERDGDNVYAVIRGIGSSSDGKGKGITAPNPVGQVKAVRRAYTDAAIDPFTVGYLEAHGTSTPVGDPVELTSVENAFKEISQTKVPAGTIRVGSVKSNIGHLKAAAGAAGALKAVLALKNGRIPASINVQELNPRIDWAHSPFSVATATTEWPRPEAHPRRAALSSFGFGGTNFHVVLEEYVPGRLKVQPPVTATANPPTTSMFDTASFRQHMTTAASLEAQSLVLDADALPDSIAKLPRITFQDDGESPRIRDVFRPLTAAGVTANRRVGLAVQAVDEIPAKLEMAQKAASNMAVARLAFNQGVFINQGKPQGKVAFLFPGQGTQYVNMCRDLASKYEVVRNTFEEADQILFDDLGGVKLTDILWPEPDTAEAREASEEKLKLTEFTQPAVLAADVAILRLLGQWGIKPDVVAGHSLGEYGALVAAGVLSFADALHAVAARGREMATVDVPDLGKMASVSADWTTVEAAIKNVEGYVIPANKNCPSQTVIAGSSDGVDNAVAALQAQNVQVMYLPVSAAFHSEIVAPASKPLRRVLGRLDVKSPKVRIISNVGAKPYPDDPEAIRDNLAVQVASPVEWIGIMERMYDEGVRTFIEVGPKKALTGFCLDILKDKPDAVAIASNHPKKGGIQHINELFAFLGAWGFQPRMPDLNDTGMYTPEFRDPTAAFRTKDTTSGALAQIMARLDALERGTARTPATATAPPSPAPAPQPAAPTPEPARPTPAPAVATAAADAKKLARFEAFGFCVDDIGISGISVGLPGKDKPLFDDANWDRIIAGENLIDAVPDIERAKLIDKNINRLVKGGDGQARFEVVDNVADVIRLAGQRGGFDMSEWGVDDDFAATLDRTFQYAIAAGIEALKDAGIPLQRTYMQTSTGSYLPKEWKLPEPLRAETGIVFASAFPGYDNMVRDISRFLADKYAGRSLDELQELYTELRDAISDDMLRGKVQGSFDEAFARVKDSLPSDGEARYQFNRKFLFNVLSLGHAQLAQFIGAMGPNTQVNAACASTTQGIAIAEDWIRTGRCRRVLVVGADDVTSDAMFEWIGAGFLASGAATTKDDVTEAALPFDARRHGMIIGMGAVGLVIEAEPEITKRGMRPIARLLGTRVANSAFHGSRLNVNHIASEMQALLADAGKRYGVNPTIAGETVFMSHETYTPARGGSASAEVAALRATFGDAANKVIVANTKGFTGHPQGAGIEDAIVLKCMQRGRLPPIANYREVDPELGDLNLSKGGEVNVRYGLRLAAGFGSQIAMTLTELVARENERISNQGEYDGWLSSISGLPAAQTEVESRTLRIVDQGPPARAPVPVATTAAEPASAPVAKPVAAPAATSTSPEEALTRVTTLVADKTGYPAEMLEADLDMEADLGIDTVKQAELFAEMREMFGVPMREDLQLKDYNTLRKVANYMSGNSGAPGPVATPPAAAPAQAKLTDAPVPQAESAAPSGDADALLADVIALVAEKTGYPAEMLEPDLDMEADLGIDTVKQAELFAELREKFDVPMREDLQLKDYNTLRLVAGYMAGNSGNATAPPATPSPTPDAPVPTPTAAAPATGTQTTPAAPTPPTANTDLEAVLADVTALVADKTGYPAEMLEADLDMEADLGIDTVKQAELFGELRTKFSVPMREDLQLKDYNTLRLVAAYMADNAGSATVEIEETVVEAAPATILRRVPVTRAEALPNQENNLDAGDVLVVGDADAAVFDALKEAGFNPSMSASDPKHLLCLADGPGDHVGALFDAAKEHQANFGAGSFVAVITRQDGHHGLTSVQDGHLAALAGLGKSLKKEFPAAVCKVIDMTELSPRDIVDEITRGGTRTEVCYIPERAVVDVVEEPLEGTPDVAGKAFVVSGGAQGITVELLAALAPQNPKLLLLGRTAQPGEAESWAALDEAGWKALEASTIEAMKAAGDKVTPVSIQKAMAPMRKAAEVFTNLQRLSDLGAEVLYAPIDVTDAERVAAAVAWGREQFGAFHGIIHAAGLEISKDLAAKDRAQFDLVYGIKHDGFDNLVAAIDDDLEWLVGFGSVAGRFGNIGQVDYAAANEYLAKSIKKVASERNIATAFTVAWGPWGEVGMATRGSIMQIMEASGVTPIPTAEGVRFFLAEMANPGTRESVVAGTVGAIDVDGQVTSGTAPAAPATEPAVAETPTTPAPADAATDEAAEPLSAGAENLPSADDLDAPGTRLLSSVVEMSRHRIVAEVTMDKSKDPYARDHSIEGVPYFPGVFGLETFAEAASLISDGECIGFDNVQFAVPLKQLKGRPAVAQATVERLDAADGRETFDCRLESRMIGPDGNAYGAPRMHFTAQMKFGRRTVETTDRPPCTRELNKDGIYPPFFHGPSFQVLRFAGPTDETVGIAHEPYAAAFAAGDMEAKAHPMLVEALFQICGLRTLVEEEKMSLPAGIQKVAFYSGSAAGEVRVWCEPTGTKDGLRTFSAYAADSEGDLVAKLTGYAMVETGPAPAGKPTQARLDFDEPETAPEPEATAEPEAHEAEPEEETATEPVAEAAATEPTVEARVPIVADIPIPTLDLGLDEDGVVFAAVAVEEADADPAWFTEAERAQHEAFKVPKRAAEWRAGRLAAKAAVLTIETSLNASRIEVRPEEGGRPRLFVDGEESPAQLTITHRDGVAIAAVSEDAMGIDLETVEERADSFMDEAFGTEERVRIQSSSAPAVQAACAWAAKEAVFKRIGTGLRSALHAWTVTPDGEGGAVAVGPEGTFGVHFFDIDGRVLAVTRAVYDEQTVEA